jgi:hypothetical protein
MKPPGIYAALHGGSVTFNVRQPSRVEDAIWNAVQEAIDAGWDAKAFKAEAASAWEEELRRQAKDAVAVLQK